VGRGGVAQRITLQGPHSRGEGRGGSGDGLTGTPLKRVGEGWLSDNLTGTPLKRVGEGWLWGQAYRQAYLIEEGWGLWEQPYRDHTQEGRLWEHPYRDRTQEGRGGSGTTLQGSYSRREGRLWG